MGEINQWYLFLVFFAAGLGLLVSVILFFFTHSDSFHSRLLAGFIACMSLLALNYGLMKTSFFIHYPFFWRAVAWASFWFQPLGYLYVRSVLKQQCRLRLGDALLFLPALVQMLCFMPYFLMYRQEKADFLAMVFENQNLIVLEPESILPPQVGIWIRILLGISCTVGQWLQLARWNEQPIVQDDARRQNEVSITWLRHFTMVNSLFWLAVLTEFGLHFSGLRTSNIDYTVIFTISGTIFFISIYLLIRPSILYGLKGWVQQEPVTKPGTIENLKESENSYIENGGVVRRSLFISSEQWEEYRNKIEEHFRQNKPYRKKGYSIGNLSAELGIPTHTLSIFINQEYGKNFNEYVNENRVYSIMKETTINENYNSYTLEALGHLAGFNSRAAFINAVKRVTGKKPSEVFGRRAGESD